MLQKSAGRIKLIFQTDVEYDKIDELVKTANDYFSSPEIIDKPKPHMDIKADTLDPFWLDFIKKNNLGTKISGVRFHCMRPGTSSASGHLHAKARGVFYIQAQEGVGDLLFPDLKIKIKPHKGLFVFVPAAENHAMSENKSDDIRIVLAFYVE